MLSVSPWLHVLFERPHESPDVVDRSIGSEDIILALHTIEGLQVIIPEIVAHVAS